jgi:long-chain fatty acid transport protein
MLGSRLIGKGANMRKTVFGAAVAALLLTTSVAMAGGFAIREQSVKGQGMSFAGVAAGGGGLSSLFWNPAISSEYNKFGFISENNTALVAPYSKSDLGSGNIGQLAIVPASYASYGLTDQLAIAASMNAPLGLTTNGNDGWAGSPLGDKSAIKTYNFNPSMSYKLNDMISVGVGAQIEYMDVKLTSRVSGSGFKFFDAQGNDIGFGFTAGVLFQPTETTDIGIGYRSSVSHLLKGDGRVVPLGFDGDIRAKFTSPETVTFGIRQQLTDDLTILGGVEWANWSRFKELRIKDETGATKASNAFDWKDSWFLSAGAEYVYNDALTLRSGVAFEKSPVPDGTRSVRVPDNDRYWLSLGASYRITDSMVANLAYSHVFIKDGDVKVLNTSFKQHLDIVSIGVTRDW